MSLACNPFGLEGNDHLLRSLFSGGRDRRLSHAYVIAGPAGSGRHLLARTIAAAALCTNEGASRPCGICGGCRKVASRIHPDVAVTAATDSGSVTVDAIRALKRDIFIAPAEGNRKIYIVERADRMTIQAQNALLKVLEEPPSYGMIILLCETAQALAPTILSRAVVLRLSLPDTETGVRAILRQMPALDPVDAKAALEKAGGCVGAALNSLLKDDDSRLSELERLYGGRLAGKSRADFLALHAKLSQSRELLLMFSDLMYRRLCALLRERAAGRPAGDRHTPYGFVPDASALALLELFRDTKDRTERNGNVSLCAFYLLADSWEVTH